MIPRKRLQVLLYILQIFYVFGDGDPGSEGMPVNELPDNIIDDTAFNTKPPHTHHVHEGLSFVEEKNSSHKSQEIFNTSYGPKADDSLSSHENVLIGEETDLNYANDASTIIKNAIVNGSSTYINISWSISGDNALLYFIDLYFDEKIIETYNTTFLNYTIKDLEPCTKYKIGVRPFTNGTNDTDTVIVNAETTFAKPEQPSFLDVAPKEPFSLNIKWEAPKFGRNCVKTYKVTVDTGDHENRHYETEYSTKTSYTFRNLYACTNYMVLVTPVDIENNDAPFISNQAPVTLPGETIPPMLNTTDERSMIITKNSVTLIWHIENKRNNCSLNSVFIDCRYNFTEGIGFKLENASLNYTIPSEQTPKNVTLTVKNLSPFTHYTCKAQVSNDAGLSNWSSPVYFLTKEDIPSPPQNFHYIGTDQLAKLFVWEAPKYIPGKLQYYKINFTWNYRYPVPDGCKLNRSFVINNLSATEVTKYSLEQEETHSDYVARISANTGAGWSQEEQIEFVSTIEGKSSEVTNLTCTIKRRDDDPNALDTELSWGLPCKSNGFLHYFNVFAFGTRSGYENHTISDTVNVTENYENNETFFINFGELRPLYTYKFEVSAISDGSTERGNVTDLDIVYPAGIPPQPDMEYVKSITLDPHKARRTTSSAAILLPLFPAENGEIKYYAIMVSGVPFDNNTSRARFDIKEEEWPNISSWEEAMEKDFTIPYQATEPMWNPFPSFVVDYGHMKAVKFVVGEDTTCPEVSAHTKNRAYCNGPLKPDTWYEVRMRAFTDHGYADSIPFAIKTNAELNVGLVLGVVFGILFIGILTTLMLLVKRCSFRLLLQRILQSNIPESPVPNPFTRRKFINHCQQLADNPGKLSNEFQLLQTLSVDLQMPSNTACLQANRKKNRYSDILPYDFSRVKLDIIDNDPNSDYINASFIRGYTGNEEYIACQGPKEETTYDFWRMIDQYDVKMIIMLTQLMERGKEKCHQYYPTIRETFNYEKFSVKCTSELDYRTYTQRTLVLQKEDKKRTISHLHFKDWPDHDVPDDFDAMIHFCQIFRKQLATIKGLSVIHCSAGIGRTGTLIAIDILLQSIRDNRKLDVFGTVYRLRRHRLNMVQRESQYAYIYNCIRQVLKNPYFSKSYKPPPIEPIYSKNKTKKDSSDSNTDSVDSFDTLKKSSLSTSIDSMQPLCQSSPQATPRIQMNVLFAGLRYCKSTSAIDTKSNHNRIGRYNSEGYAICESERDSFSISNKKSIDENDLKSSSSSLYENIEPLIEPSSSQTIAGSSYYLTNESVEKDTSL